MDSFTTFPNSKGVIAQTLLSRKYFDKHVIFYFHIVQSERNEYLFMM